MRIENFGIPQTRSLQLTPADQIGPLARFFFTVPNLRMIFTRLKGYNFKQEYATETVGGLQSL